MDKSILDLIGIFVLIAGGILATASLIVAKKPNARELIAKIQPFQASIGVFLLVMGIINLLRFLPHIKQVIDMAPALAAVIMAVIACSVLLGLMFGMPIVARFSPQGAAKGEELAKQLAPFHTLIGVVGIVAGIAELLYYFELLKPY